MEKMHNHVTLSNITLYPQFRINSSDISNFHVCHFTVFPKLSLKGKGIRKLLFQALFYDSETC